MDAERLRASFAQVASCGDAVALHFYSDWFLRQPQLRDLFPAGMAAQREHLTGALAQIVTEAGRAEELGPFLAHLGRSHRKFGVLPEHHASLHVSLKATMEHFLGEDAWEKVAADWDEALGVISEHMIAAAAEDEKHAPPWWQATVLSAEHRAYDVTVLRAAVDPDGPRLTWTPGQSVSVEIPSRPRLWRYLSPASPPREDGVLEFHVRVSAGGQVSPALAALHPGDTMRIGPPGGVMTWDGSGRPLLMCAWSTGLAPLKAILLQLAGLPVPPSVHLYAGARVPEGLYDMPALEELAARCPWLTLVPLAAEGRQGWTGQAGLMHEVVARGDWTGHDACIAGPSEMTVAVAAALTAGGMPQERIHVEDFGRDAR